MKLKGVIFSLILFIGTSGFSQNALDDLLKKYNSGDVAYTSVEQLRMNQLNDEVIILDAREINEYKTSHLKDSKFIGYNNLDLTASAKHLGLLKAKLSKLRREVMTGGSKGGGNYDFNTRYFQWAIIR